MDREKFYHPFEPYEIQKQFMTVLYDCIEHGKVGIFESPTGTGKSLSLICGSLTWLRENKRRRFDQALDEDIQGDDEPQWILEHSKAEKRRRALEARADLETRLAKVREREKKLKERSRSDAPAFKRRKIGKDSPSDPTEEEQYVLDDYESGDDSKDKLNSENGLSAETLSLMKKLGMVRQPDEETIEVDDEIKILYCSRTHSQLAQFTSELRRVKLPPAIEPDTFRSVQDTKYSEELTEELRHLTLGSRKNLCINPKVKKLGDATAINERCLELQKPGTSTDCKCPFLPTKEDQAMVNDFRDAALANIRDIEDLAAVGKDIGICPYYASREAIKPSEIVTLPYPLLLLRSTRDVLNLSLKDHVVIIDEAHNLMDAITAIYSSAVSLSQLQKARTQLTIYLQKFRNRLKGKNRVYVAQIVRLLDSLIAYLISKSSVENAVDHIVQVDDLMTGKGVDQINLFKLTRYLQESKLARKVDGYISFEEESQSGQGKVSNGNQPTRPATVPVLTHIQGFLLALMNPSAEGRFFCEKTEDGRDISLRYMLLDPTNHFRDIVEEARAVVLAGGTMSPMDDYIHHLFSYVPKTLIVTLSCGHVIPPENLVAWPVSTGQTSEDFDLTFSKRASKNMMTNVGQALLAFVCDIPDGVVVFFPSYAYLDSCVKHWKSTMTTDGDSHTSTFWDSMNALKPVFAESRENPTSGITKKTDSRNVSSDSLLASYSKRILDSKDHRGALLLSVVNGSLSEGINFSDRLGRAVIVIGMPFPNPHSAEWKAKMEYIAQKTQENNRSANTSLTEAEKLGKAAAQNFYENATMRAVNQAIGRAIRHKNDYAAILLIDKRYATERIRTKLPGWIKSSLKKPESIGDISKGLREFFASKQ